MKNLSIGKKLYLAFGIVIILTIITGGVSVWRLKNVSDVFGSKIKTKITFYLFLKTMLPLQV